MNSASVAINSFSKHGVPEGNSQMRCGLYNMVTLEPSLVWHLQDAQRSSVEWIRGIREEEEENRQSLTL